MTLYLHPSYDKTVQAERTVIVNKHIVSSSIPAAVTNGTDGTYNYYLDMDNFKNIGIQFTLSGGSGTVTVKIYITLQDDGTAPASCAYQDITSDLIGIASFTSSRTILDDDGVLSLAKYVKIEVIASTGGANDGDWTIYARRVD